MRTKKFGEKTFWASGSLFQFWPDGGRAHFVIESKVQWKPFGLPPSSIDRMTCLAPIYRILWRMRPAPIVDNWRKAQDPRSVFSQIFFVIVLLEGESLFFWCNLPSNRKVLWKVLHLILSVCVSRWLFYCCNHSLMHARTHIHTHTRTWWYTQEQ